MTFLQGYYMQVWQWGPPHAAERTIDEAIALCHEYNIQGLLLKALDGTTWMGDVDHSPDAIHGHDDIHRLRLKCSDAGLGFGVWTNPLHGDTGYLARQAMLYAQAGDIAGLLALDVEPFGAFWGANRPKGDAAYFTDSIRSHAPDLPIIFQPDPRPARLAELRPDEWIANANVMSGQHYWTNFDTTWYDEYIAAFNNHAKWPSPETAPTFPGNAPAGGIAGFVRAIMTSEAQGAIIWRLGTTGPEQLATIRDNPFPPHRPAPTIEERLAAVELSMRKLIDQQDRTRSLLQNAGAILETI